MHLIENVIFMRMPAFSAFSYLPIVFTTIFHITGSSYSHLETEKCREFPN